MSFKVAVIRNMGVCSQGSLLGVTDYLMLSAIRPSFRYTHFADMFLLFKPEATYPNSS